MSGEWSPYGGATIEMVGLVPTVWFPRSPWEPSPAAPRPLWAEFNACSVARSMLVATRSVAQLVPTEDRGNKSQWRCAFVPLTIHHSPLTASLNNSRNQPPASPVSIAKALVLRGR